MDWFIRRLDVVERCMEKKEETCAKADIFLDMVSLILFSESTKSENKVRVKIPANLDTRVPQGLIYCCEDNPY